MTARAPRKTPTKKRRVAGRMLSVTILLTLFFSSIAAGSSVALAANDTSTGCHHFQKGKAPKGHGKFEPVAFEPYADEIDTCGGITVTPGDVSRVQTRTTVQRNGSTFYEYRGRTTNDIVAADGRKINELDTGGSYSYLFAADNSSGILTVNGPALIYPFSAEEQELFDAAGLPRAFYYAKGTLVAKTDGDGAITGFVKVPRYVSVCDLLKNKSRT